MYRCPQFIYPVIFAAKFNNVKNAGAIRARIVKAATMDGADGDEERDAVNFAFINAKLVSRRRVALGRRSSVSLDCKSSPSADRCRPGAVGSV